MLFYIKTLLFFLTDVIVADETSSVRCTVSDGVQLPITTGMRIRQCKVPKCTMEIEDCCVMICNVSKCNTILEQREKRESCKRIKLIVM